MSNRIRILYPSSGMVITGLVLQALFWICYPLNVTAQEGSVISIEVGAGSQQMRMSELNEYYIDAYARPLGLLDGIIQRGPSISGRIAAKTARGFEIGVMVNIQEAVGRGDPELYVIEEFNEISGPYPGKFFFKAHSFGVGIDLAWYFSQGLGLEQHASPWLNQLHLALEGGVANGRAGFTAELDATDILEAPEAVDDYTATGLQGHLHLKLEYDLGQKKSRLCLGFRAGQQFYRTDVLRDPDDNAWTVLGKDKISFDFSGWYWGGYLKIKFLRNPGVGE